MPSLASGSCRARASGMTHQMMSIVRVRWLAALILTDARPPAIEHQPRSGDGPMLARVGLLLSH